MLNFKASPHKDQKFSCGEALKLSRILMLRPLCGNALIRWEISGENTVPDESELNVFIPPEEILLLTE